MWTQPACIYMETCTDGVEDTVACNLAALIKVNCSAHSHITWHHPEFGKTFVLLFILGLLCCGETHRQLSIYLKWGHFKWSFFVGIEDLPGHFVCQTWCERKGGTGGDKKSLHTKLYYLQLVPQTLCWGMPCCGSERRPVCCVYRVCQEVLLIFITVY